MPHLVATLIYLSQIYSYYIRGDRSPLSRLKLGFSILPSQTRHVHTAGGIQLDFIFELDFIFVETCLKPFVDASRSTRVNNYTHVLSGCLQIRLLPARTIAISEP